MSFRENPTGKPMENLGFFTQQTHGAIAPRLWKIIVLKPLHFSPSNEVAMIILVDWYKMFQKVFVCFNHQSQKWFTLW